MDDDFQPTFTSFFEAGYHTELTILKALSIGLGLPEDALGQRHAAQTNELRITHYPEVARADFAHSTRIAAHTDFGTITLLFQDAVGGLRGLPFLFFPLRSCVRDVMALTQGCRNGGPAARWGVCGRRERRAIRMYPEFR